MKKIYLMLNSVFKEKKKFIKHNILNFMFILFVLCITINGWNMETIKKIFKILNGSKHLSLYGSVYTVNNI